MSTKPFRFRPSLQPLENRRLMAGDGFGIHGFINTDDPADDRMSNTIMVGEIHTGTVSNQAEDATDNFAKPGGNGDASFEPDALT